MGLWPGIGAIIVASIAATSALGGSRGDSTATGSATRNAVPRPATGTYSGKNSQNGNGATMFVPVGAASVVNFSIPAVNLVCTGGGGGGVTNHIWVLKAAIWNRSFTTTTTQVGVVGFARAKFTYSVTGRFQGTSAGGRYREDIAFPDIPGRSCTSKNQSWTATRATQPAPKTPIAPGTYSGRNSQNGNGITFSVPVGAGSVLNFSIPAVNLFCVGAGGIPSKLTLAEATIKSDRTFTSKTTQSTVVNQVNATVTYTVKGTFQGVDAAGAPTAAGMYRQDIVFADASARTCTSNDQTWTVTRAR
jgi:hypothetical protein